MVFANCSGHVAFVGNNDCYSLQIGAITHTISKSKCYSRYETRNELRYYEPSSTRNATDRKRWAVKWEIDDLTRDVYRSKKRTAIKRLNKERDRKSGAIENPTHNSVA